MKWIHPNVCWIIALIALALLTGFVGCRNQPGGMPNPFLAPDRVPPPATRTLLPGQAQPYYPGDPLPVMQSGVAPPAAANTANASPQQQPAGPTLAWNAPTGGTPAMNSPAEPRALAFSNEPSVAIPSDGGSLRFPLPAPPPEPIAPIALSAPAATQQPAQQLAAVPATQTVLPASHSVPAANLAPTANNALAMGEVEPAATSPWRSPQVAQPSVAPGYGQPLIITQPLGAQPLIAPVAAPAAPVYVAPFASTPSTMDVRLRAVPSPPPEPADSPTPRIRLPGYPAPQPLIDADTRAQPTPFYATPASAISVGAVQMVQASPLPPMVYDPTVNMAAAPQTSGSRDGFRPRSSMR